MEQATVCSARQVLEELEKSTVRVAWPHLAYLLDVPLAMQHRIDRLRKVPPQMQQCQQEYKVDIATLVREEESLRQVLSYWENNDPDHTWERLSLALMSDPIYKELGASLYFKHVKPEEFTLDKVYEEVKEITNPWEIAYVLIQDSKKLRNIWGSKDELIPEERTKLAISHWMTNYPDASWMLLAKHLECIHGEYEFAAWRIATTIREKYLPKVDEKMEFEPPREGELQNFGANEAFKKLTAVDDWFGLGRFLDIEEEELKQIESEHQRDDDRKLAMLELWVELNPRSSWYSLATALIKMPQHQSLAEDILEQERQRVIQRELDERPRELYNQFFRPLFESLCNEQVYSSLVEQLMSMFLISEADKERLLSSIQHPKVRASSLLEVLNIEEKPYLLMELIKAMEEVDNLKGLADEMLALYKANGESTIKCPSDSGRRWHSEGDEYSERRWHSEGDEYSERRWHSEKDEYSERRWHSEGDEYSERRWHSEGDEYLLLPPRSAPEAALPVLAPQTAPLTLGLRALVLAANNQMPPRRVGTPAATKERDEQVDEAEKSEGARDPERKRLKLTSVATKEGDEQVERAEKSGARKLERKRPKSDIETPVATKEGDEQVWEAEKSEGAREPERKRLKLGIETPVAAKEGDEPVEEAEGAREPEILDIDMEILDMEIHVATKGPRPTMDELISMERRDGSRRQLRIIHWITSHKSTQCTDFAYKLLKCRPTVRKLRKDHTDDDEFIRAVLETWLGRDDDDDNESEDSVPCTWDNLVKCLKGAGLDGELIKLLRDNIPKAMSTL